MATVRGGSRVFLACFLCSMPIAQAMGASTGPSGAPGEGVFLQRALGVNELELRLGHLAAERATTSEVREMGQKMIQKHTDVGQQLRSLARGSGATDEAVMSPDQRQTLAHVRKQSGPEFDRTFKQVVDEGHVKELAMYQGELSKAPSPRLRALAEQRVAALQKSMSTAQPKPAAETAQ